MTVKAKNIQFAVDIPEGLTRTQKEAIAQEIIDYIRNRTEDGENAEGRKFPKYSKAYVKSLDFRNAKGGDTKVNLTLSGDMLTAMRLVQSKKDELVIGYKTNDPEAGRVEGNVIGSYGRDPNPKVARDFLGFKSEKERRELDKIIAKYVDEQGQTSAEQSSKAVERARAIAAKFGTEI